MTTSMTNGNERFLARLLTFWRNIVGYVLEKIHAPAMIKEFEHVDAASDEAIYLSTGARYSVLHVGRKRFFFDRITGRFDGTGTLLEERIVERLQFSD